MTEDGEFFARINKRQHFDDQQLSSNSSPPPPDIGFWFDW
jgi:hypothetical protein